MGGVAQALTDKDFQGAMPDDQIKYLSSVDKDFASAKREDQVGYLNHIKGNTGAWPYKSVAKPDTSESGNFSREATEFGLGAASGASGLPETMHPVKDLAKGAPPTSSDAMGTAIGTAIAGPGYGIGKSLYNTGKEIFSPKGAHEDPEDAAMRRSHGVGTVAGMVAPLAIGEGVEKAPGEIGAARESIGASIHTPEGKLTPGARATGSTVGVLAGGGAGHMTGIPGAGTAGGVAGYRLGPSLMEKMFPAPYAEKGAPFPSASEFYENRGADLMKRKPPKPESDATEKNVPFAGEENMFSAPFERDATRQNIPFAGEEPEAVGTKIAEPSQSGRTPQGAESEGRPATWTNEKVKELASWGDHDAMEQAQLRGFGRIPLKFSTASVNPRSVTHFDTIGKPIESQSAQPAGLKPGGLMHTGGLKLSTDNVGVRWAESGGYRVSVPKSVPEGEIEAYARPRLEEQARIHGNISKK